MIALSSIAMTTYLFFTPSKTKLYSSYSLIALTIISGTYLTFTQPTHLMQTCAAGLIYIVFVVALLVGAQYKFARAKIRLKQVKN